MKTLLLIILPLISIAYILWILIIYRKGRANVKNDPTDYYKAFKYKYHETLQK